MAAGHRAVAVVTIIGDGQHKPRLVARLRLEAAFAFHDRPAEVEAARRRVSGGDKVDLFKQILAHVGDPQVAGGAVKAIAPGVAQADCPDFSAHFLAVPVRRHPWIVSGDDIGVRAVAGDIDAQHLAQQGGRVLTVAEEIVGGSAVTHPDPEITIRPKGEHPAVVVGRRLFDLEQGTRAGSVGLIGVGGRDDKARDDRIAVQVGVVDEELAALGIVGRKGQAQ